jgi:ATP-dependent Clp protease protease subunit
MEQYLAFKDNLIEEMKLNSALKRRTIYITEDINDDIMFKVDYMIDRIIRADEELIKKGKITKPEPIKLIINSYGGSIYDGLGLISKIEYLQEEKGYEFHGEVPAYAMSMGSSLLSICKKRVARRYATILYHTPLSGTHGSLSDMQTSMDEVHRLWRLMKTISMKHTNMTEEFLDSMYDKNKDFYMTVEEAMEYGVIDEIL